MAKRMAAADGHQPRWSAHPWRARGLRLLVYALPIAGSLVFVRLATTVVGVPTRSLWVFLLWWLAMSLSATGVVSLVYAVSRRLLPLGALLDLSLVFPDESPSRFRLALRTGTVESLEERLHQLRQANEPASAQEAAEILLQLAGALDVHDKITRGHSERVRAYSYSLGKQLSLAGEELDRLNWAALLHDVGKLDVSTEILNKAGKPTDEEWEQLRRHPLYGETLVEPLNEWLGTWTDAVGYHHEQWDGKGYPRGIAGEEIPLAGRIVAIADVYDVITSARSYKEPASPTEARAELARCAGTQFDPRLVRAFVNISLGKMRLVMGPLSWLSHAPLLARLPLTPFFGASLGGVAVIATTAVAGIAGPQDTAQAASLRAAAPIVQSTHAHTASGQQPTRRPATLKSDEPKRRVRPDAEPAAPEAPRVTPLADTTQAPALPPAAEPETEPTTPDSTPPAPPQAPPTPKPPASPGTPPTSPAPAVPPTPAPVTPNAPPSFISGASQTVLEDAGAQSIVGWATAISRGPASEGSQNVSFTASADNPGLFTVQPAIAANGKLTFTPAANAGGVATITVIAVDDGGTANGGNDTSAAHTFTITITAVNDAPSFSAGANQTVLEDTGAQSIPAWATGMSAGPPNEASQNVTFAVAADIPALFAVQPAIAPNGELTYTPAVDASGLATITVTAMDNGGAANGGVDASAASTFTITLTAVNDVPGFNAGANQTALEDSGAQSIAGWATAISPGPASESSQTVSFTVIADTPALFTTQPAIAPGGTLTYITAANANGLATITVTAVDNGSTANGGADTSAVSTFTIAITPVNDAPSFTAGANQAVVSLLGAQTILGWATGISAGPADEFSQTVTFVVTNDNPGLFAIQPAIAPNGRLTYTPALLALGTATVTVRAIDNGGTADGGSDTSAPQTFTITIL
jgi:HD domain